VLAQASKQTRFDQGTFPASARSVDQPHPEGQVGIKLFDSPLPKSDGLGQSIPIPWSRQQLQEEVGIVLVEGTQSLRHDLDRALIGVGWSGGGRKRGSFQG